MFFMSEQKAILNMTASALVNNTLKIRPPCTTEKRIIVFVLCVGFKRAVFHACDLSPAQGSTVSREASDKEKVGLISLINQ